MGGRALFGRKVTYTGVVIINDNNIIDVLQKALLIHLMNQADISYLYRCYREDQLALYWKKEARPKINNKVAGNRANEIVSSKVSYPMGEPVQYVSRGDDEKTVKKIMQLNDYILSEDKVAKDKEPADWSHIRGTSCRTVLPNGMADVEGDETPFEIFTLDPRYSPVVHSTALGNPTMMGVQYILKDDGALASSCYVTDHYYEVEGTWATKRSEEQYLNIPITEYLTNKVHLGAFEIVLPLLDATNSMGSNRSDGVEQFVQTLMLFHNADTSFSDYHGLREEGTIKYKDIDPQLKVEIGYLTAELNQTQTQTLVGSMYNTVLTIRGMSNRSGGSSVSDIGPAVIIRGGWSATEAEVKSSELIFKKSGKELLKILLRTCDNLSDPSLKLSAIEIRFTRRNYENITEKASVLITMLNNPKIAPVLAFIHCGMFSDPQAAYKVSIEYAGEQERKAVELAAKQQNNRKGEGDESGRESRKSDTGSGESDRGYPETL